MELRSQRQKRDANEYAELRITLTGLGFYEENMELSEMRQILQALQMSESDIENHFQENESGFCDVNDARTSTMIHPPMQSVIDSPSSSPEPHFEILTVQALVHHPMNWSPLGRNNVDHNNGNIGENSNCGDEASPILRKRNLKTSVTTETKRLCLNSIENAPDSGVSLSNSTSNNLSPVWETLWENSSFEMAAHSSTQYQSELFCSNEELSAIHPNTSNAVLNRDEQNWD